MAGPGRPSVPADAPVLVGTEAVLHRVRRAAGGGLLGLRPAPAGPPLRAPPRRPWPCWPGPAGWSAAGARGAGRRCWSRPGCPTTRCWPPPCTATPAGWPARAGPAAPSSTCRRPARWPCVTGEQAPGWPQALAVGDAGRRGGRRWATAAGWCGRPDHRAAVRRPGRGTAGPGRLRIDGRSDRPVAGGRPFGPMWPARSRPAITIVAWPATASASTATPSSSSRPRGRGDRRLAGHAGRRHDRDHVRRPGVGPGGQPGRGAAPALRLRRRGRTPGGHQPAHRRDRGRVDLRRGVPVGARAELAHRPARPGPPGRAGPRRQRDLDRGRRARGPGLPARARPPRRRAAGRAARRRAAPGGPAHPAGPGPRPARRIPTASRPAATEPPGPLARDRVADPVARLAYLGTPELAVPPLRALVEAGHEMAAGRHPGRPPAGPGLGASAQPGQGGGHRARPAGHRPPGRRARRRSRARRGRGLRPDRPGRVLEAVPMVNLHFSLLPRWRGAAPVERAILAGDP